MRALFSVVLLASSPAFAEGVLHLSSVPGRSAGSAFVSSRAFGGGASFSRPGFVDLVGGELSYAHGDGVAELRGLLSHSLADGGRWFLQGELHPVLLGVLLGPADVAAGTHLALAGGFRSGRFRAELRATAGAEVFARTADVRFPQRLSLGLGLDLEAVEFGLFGRAGADQSPGDFWVLRYEGGLSVGRRF